MSCPPPPPPPPPPPAAPSTAPVAPASSSTSKPKSKWTVDLPVERDWKDLYPFHCAAQLGDAGALQTQLSSGGVDLDAADDDSWAALHYAAWYGHVDAVGVLLAAGANADVRNGAQATPLHFAAGAGRVAVVRALLDAGADRTLRSNEKQTPADLAKQLQPDGHEQILRMLQGELQ